MGRDSGMYFIVVEADEKYVSLVDGTMRKVERPKRKKIKHVEMTEFYIESIAEKITNGKKISNQDVKKALKEVRKNI